MSGYVLKPARGSVTYMMDWRRGYLAPGERVLRDLGWSVQPDAPKSDARLIVTEQAHDPSRSWATFAGGAPGRVYMVANRVRTSDDRVLSRAIVMRIAGEGGRQCVAPTIGGAALGRPTLSGPTCSEPTCSEIGPLPATRMSR